MKKGIILGLIVLISVLSVAFIKLDNIVEAKKSDTVSKDEVWELAAYITRIKDENQMKDIAGKFQQVGLNGIEDEKELIPDMEKVISVNEKIIEQIKIYEVNSKEAKIFKELRLKELYKINEAFHMKVELIKNPSGETAKKFNDLLVEAKNASTISEEFFFKYTGQ